MTKVLVAHASRRGSTAEVAEAIAATLRDAGLDVDCRPAHDVHDVTAYDAVVLGSAVYMGRWRGDAKRVLRKFAHELAERPLWLFSSGPVGEPQPDEEGSKWLEPPRIVAQAEALGARGHVVVGGRVPDPPHGRIERNMLRTTPEEWRDRRDWDAIRAWAQEIAAALVPQPV